MLTEGEVLVHEDGASHFHNFIAVGGRLMLTDKRLVFCSNGCVNSYRHEWSADLAEIGDVEFFKTMLINPNGMALLFKDGRMENFIVDDRRAWRDRILARVTQLA